MFFSSAFRHFDSCDKLFCSFHSPSWNTSNVHIKKNTFSQSKEIKMTSWNLRGIGCHFWSACCCSSNICCGNVSWRLFWNVIHIQGWDNFCSMITNQSQRENNFNESLYYENLFCFLWKLVFFFGKHLDSLRRKEIWDALADNTNSQAQPTCIFQKDLTNETVQFQPEDICHWRWSRPFCSQLFFEYSCQSVAWNRPLSLSQST